MPYKFRAVAFDGAFISTVTGEHVAMSSQQRLMSSIFGETVEYVQLVRFGPIVTVKRVRDIAEIPCLGYDHFQKI